MTAVEQLAAIGSALGVAPMTATEVAVEFGGADEKHVARHLETLAMMGEIDEEGGGYWVRKSVA